MRKYIQIDNEFELTLVLAFLKKRGFVWTFSAKDYNFLTSYYLNNTFFLRVDDYSLKIVDTPEAEKGYRTFKTSSVIKEDLQRRKRKLTDPYYKENKRIELITDIDEVNSIMRGLRSDGGDRGATSTKDIM